MSSCPGALFCIIISIKVAQYNFNVFSNQGNISSDMNNIFSLLLNTCPQGCPAVMSLWIITSNLKFLFYTFGLVLLERNLCIPPPKMLLPLIYPPLLLPTHSFPSFCNSSSLHQGQLAGRGRRRETLGHPTSMNCVDLLILMLWTWLGNPRMCAKSPNKLYFLSNSLVILLLSNNKSINASHCNFHVIWWSNTEILPF